MLRAQQRPRRRDSLVPQSRKCHRSRTSVEEDRSALLREAAPPGRRRGRERRADQQGEGRSAQDTIDEASVFSCMSMNSRPAGQPSSTGISLARTSSAGWPPIPWSG